MSPHLDAPSLPGSFDDQFSSMILSDHTSMVLRDTLKPPYLPYADSMSDATLTDSDEETAIHPTRPLVPGLYVPTVAFFNKATEELDLATIARHAVRLAEAGVAGLTTQGSNG